MAASLATKDYWSRPAAEVVATLDSAAGGLPQAEAQRRLREFGPNRLRDANGSGALSAPVRQFASSLVLILLFAASVSLGIGEWLDASIVLASVAASGLLGFAQEYSASRAGQKLRQRRGGIHGSISAWWWARGSRFWRRWWFWRAYTVG